MAYNYKAIIGNGDKSHEMEVTGEIYISKAFDYGNGKGMALTINGQEYLYDIRYDTDYTGNDKAYIEMSIRNLWNGKNGAWLLQELIEM